MKLSITNIAKIKDVDIEINGLTVLAGENNSGKSTIGKVLFAIFQSFNNPKSNFYRDRQQSVSRELNELQLELSMKRLSEDIDIDFDNIISQIISDFDKFDQVKNTDIIEVLKDTYSTEGYQEKLNSVKKILSISEETVINGFLQRTLDLEFNGQINSVFSRDLGKVELKIKESRISFEIGENKVENVAGVIPLATDIVYIDNPLIIENFVDSHSFTRTLIKNLENSGTMRAHAQQLEVQFEREPSSNIVDLTLIKNRFEGIEQLLSKVYDWDLISDNQHIKTTEQKNKLNIKNISSGMKSFYLIKKLIENGTIKENGTIVLDEPEVHLHPEWQLIYAEIIVLLQKELGLHILLSTHSPYFLNAIEVFSKKYGTEDKCKYYLSENNGYYSTITEMTDGNEPIYKKLAAPLQYLENVRFSEDD